MSCATVPGVALALALATVFLSCSVAFNFGAYDDRAVAFVLLGMLLLGCAYVWTTRRFAASGAGCSPYFGHPIPALVLAPPLSALLLGCVFWAWSDPALVMYAQRPWDGGHQALFWTMVLLVTYVPPAFDAYREPTAVKLTRFALIAVLVLLAGLDTLSVSPTPSIDVWTVQQQGADALLHGHNPFAAVRVLDTTPGRIGAPVPYVYAPTQVLVGVPAYALFRDVRYAMLLAMLVVGFALRGATWRARSVGLPAIVEDAPALLVWCMPKVFFVLEQSWVDPVQLMFVSVGCLLAVYEKTMAAAIVLGLASSSKQTLFWILPLAGFGLRFRPREWIAMVAAAAAPVLPFALLDFKALKHGTFDFLTALPARSDGLTLANCLDRRYPSLHLEGRAGFPLAAAAVAFSSWRHRTPAGVAVALAFTCVLFFAFGKWAFANYYYFVAGLSAVAAACSIALGARVPGGKKSEPEEAGPAAARNGWWSVKRPRWRWPSLGS